MADIKSSDAVHMAEYLYSPRGRIPAQSTWQNTCTVHVAEYLHSPHGRIPAQSTWQNTCTVHMAEYLHSPRVAEYLHSPQGRIPCAVHDKATMLKCHFTSSSSNPDFTSTCFKHFFAYISPHFSLKSYL